MAAWQVPISIGIDNSNPQLPPVTTVRIEVTHPQDQTPLFTIDVPAVEPKTSYVLAVGDGTSLPADDYCLRVRGINDALHSVSQESSALLVVDAPSPKTPLIGGPLMTQFAPPAATTPTPSPTTQGA